MSSYGDELCLTPHLALFYYEARALAHSPPSPYCIMSPNQNIVRAVPSEDSYTTKHIILELYTDGSYGPHEYSTEPQVWDPTRPHLPWIPRSPAALGGIDGLEGVEGLDVLWRPLHKDDYVRLNPGVDFFRVSEAYGRQLQRALAPIRRLAESVSRDHAPENDDVRTACDLARHSLLHASYASAHSLPALVDLVRGCKRYILECYGHLLYRLYGRRAPVIDPVYEDLARPARDVVGVFTHDLEVTRQHVRRRIPVWRIALVASLPNNMKIAARVPFTPTFYPYGEKKLIAHVYDGEPYIAKLVVANPSQGLYVPVDDTGRFRIAGSVNTAGEVVSSAEAMEKSEEARLSRPGSSSGGPARTYPGTSCQASRFDRLSSNFLP